MERYEAYKDSGIAWVGQMPASWEEGSLERFAEILGSGATPSTDNELYYDGGIPWLQVRDLGKGRVAAASRAITDKALEDYSAIRIYRAPFLAIAMYASIGSISFVEQDSAVNQAICAIANGNMDLRYLYYHLLAWEPYLLADGQGGTQKNISQQYVRKLRVLAPALKEQQAIADYLDARTAEIDVLVEDCERQVGLLREYRKAVISEAVTKGLDPDAPMKDSGVEWIGEIPERWELSRVGWLGVCLNGDRGINYPSGEDMQDEGVPFVVTDALHGDEIDRSRCKFISEERYKLLGGVKLRINDIAFCLRGSVGTCAINTFANEGTVASSLMAIRPISCNSNWLYYVLISEGVSKQVESYMNGTCAANLSAEGVSKFKVPLPLNDEQVAIANYLDAKTAEIDSLIDAKQSMADKLREYRRSLISEAVTGKFKVPGVR